MRFLCNCSITNRVTALQSIDKFTKNMVFDKDIFQQIFVDLQEGVVNVAISGVPRHLEDIFQNEKLFCIRKTFF